MSAVSLARHFAYASSAPSGRVAGAVLAALSFFPLHAAAQEPAGGVAAQTPGRVTAERRAGPRVITNEDLEPLRLRREAGEAEYERTRRGRGMPSKQELRRHFEEQDRRLHESALRVEKERAEAELESVRSELGAVRRHLYELSLRLPRQTESYPPTYVPANYYPYFYVPAVPIITRFPSGQRGVFGRGKFWPHPRVGVWTYNQRQSLFSHPPGGTPLNRNTPPRAHAPSMPALRR